MQTSKEALNNCKADSSPTFPNFPISKQYAVKCVKMRCYYKAASSLIIAWQQFKERHFFHLTKFSYFK